MRVALILVCESFRYLDRQARANCSWEEECLRIDNIIDYAVSSDEPCNAHAWDHTCWLAEACGPVSGRNALPTSLIMCCHSFRQQQIALAAEISASVDLLALRHQVLPHEKS